MKTDNHKRALLLPLAAVGAATVAASLMGCDLVLGLDGLDVAPSDAPHATATSGEGGGAGGLPVCRFDQHAFGSCVFGE